MIKQQGFLATFRIDEELWGKFKNIAKNKQTNASALIIQYIQSVVGGDAIPQNIDNSCQLSIHDIDNRIDEKIRQSIQDINTPSIQNIEDLIDSRISGSIADGDIKGAIAHSYKSTIDQFNGHLEELQNQIGELKKQVQELQSVPVAAPVPPSADNSPAPETIEDVITILGVADILGGDQYWEDKLIESGINQKIVENVIYLSEKLNIKVSPKGYIIARFNSILTALGYGNKKQGQHTKTDGKKQDKYIAVKVPK